MQRTVSAWLCGGVCPVAEQARAIRVGMSPGGRKAGSSASTRAVKAGTWAAHGLPSDLAGLLAAAAHVPGFPALVDPDDPRFLPPGDMPARIAAYCTGTGQTPPQSQAETVRCILDSLALAYRRCVRKAAELSGRSVENVHLVGGGARNTLLCQLTADACGLPVMAGPVEAAAIGNALVQARAGGVLSGGLAELRSLIRRTSDVQVYLPRADAEAAWSAAEERLPAPRT